MIVTISPEMEALIKKQLQLPSVQTPEDVLLSALLLQDKQTKTESNARAVELALNRLGEEAFWRGVQQTYGEIAGSPHDVLVYQQEIADWVKTMHRR